MLLLSGEDVEKVLSMEDAIDVMEDAFRKYATGEYEMPTRVFSKVKGEDDYALMPCFVDEYIGLKVVTSYPSNYARKNPVTQGVILLNDRETGDPLALIEGTILTAIKTAAVSGVAVRHLKPEAKTIGLVGTGIQGIYQLMAAEAETEVETIYLYNRSPEKINGFIREYKELTSSTAQMIGMEDVHELINKSDVIITATTSVDPVLPNEEAIYNGKLIVGVGSYKSNMRELPEKLFRSAEQYIIDSEQGKVECGDIMDPLENKWISEKDVVLLSDILCGNQELVRSNPSSPLIFKSVSMALFDAMIGAFVYTKAKEQGIGTTFNM
ncbi:ornithine cyclodeaminase family protein [Sporosarcina siberiensis]|uniref:Ornithine cyclodeaminase family protein n=1 Tax=Sporosarcina siberiensis TaxID=1365606 RepID=A0ABW4SF54_9BACL